MVEQLPDGIPYFFALAFFVAGVIIFFSAGEGVHPSSVILSITFFVLGGVFIWLTTQNSLIPLP
jgi:hypothetical protein